MIILSLSIALLALCSFVIGNSSITRLLFASCSDNQADRAFLCTWLGALILANLLLALSLFSPLTPAVAASALCLLLLFSLHRREERAAVLELASLLRPGIAFGSVALLLGVAAYCSQVIVWYDTKLYHMQAIKWLSEYGTVPGEALIHQRLGFVSAWFALPASLNHGLLQGRMASATGGFSLLLLVGHLLVALFRVAGGKAPARESFLLLAYLPTLAVVMLYGLPSSPSPDLPVIILVVESAWAMMLVSEFRRRNPAGFGRPLNPALIPLLLGAGATALKLSAFPILALSLGYYLLSGRFAPGKLILSGAALFFFLVPLAAAGVVSAGCALYPSPLFCTELPWSLGPAQAAAESALIRDWARWGGSLAPSGATSWNWIVPWLEAEGICTLLLALSLPAALLLLSRGGGIPGCSFVAALAASGIAFMFYAAPTWRFGLGYLVLLPALGFAAPAGRLLARSPFSGSAPAPLACAGAGAAMALLLATHIYLVPRPTFAALEEFARRNPREIAGDRPHFNLLLPPALWRADFEQDPVSGGKRAAPKATLLLERSAELSYWHPEPEKSELCCDAPLPCSPTLRQGVRLRDKAAGIAGGFVATGGREKR